MQRQAHPEQRKICGGQRRYTTPSPLRNLQQRRRHATEKRWRDGKRFDRTPEWAEGKTSRHDQRDRICDRSRGSRREPALGRDRLDREPPLYPTDKWQVGRELDPEHAHRRRKANPAGGCMRNGGGRYHRSERIKRKRDPNLSPRRTKSVVRPLKRRTEPEAPGGKELSHFGANVAEARVCLVTRGKACRIKPTLPPLPSPVDAAGQGRGADSEHSLRPGQIGVPASEKGVEVATRMDEELHTAIWSISGQPNPSGCYLPSAEDEEYNACMWALEEEDGAALCESGLAKAYDDINLITYPDCIEPCASVPPNGYQVPPWVATSRTEPLEFHSSLRPPPETGNDDLDNGGAGRQRSQPDAEPHKDEPGTTLWNESLGVRGERASLFAESKRRKPGTPAEEELAHRSAEGSAGPRLWDGIPGISLSKLEDLITCPSCKRIFNRAPVCHKYFLGLNRPVQCLCGCVLCTLCFRAQGGCREHRVASEHETVNATANALADLPEMEGVGVWDLEREGRDRFVQQRSEMHGKNVGRRAAQSRGT
ncbi:uncharacterized protein LOC111948983 [Oryzias latipes]|uniref:uncharacterized protein LOC111948983 n=1 Tax=Oryzias latipes TaxID=8090 RepID=UPI000CE1AB24|nr:uncharacterized protein LOC111948983 [Oryzias latipes]